MSQKWYQESYRRLLLDMHIDDWDERFLSQLDPQKFIDSVLAAGVTALTVPANNHVGLSFYPTQVGTEHRQVKGQNILGQLISAAHAKALHVIVYYCTVYVDRYWEQHPEARIVDAEGVSEKLMVNNQGTAKRFSVCCLNNAAYRDFVVTQLKELCERYDFEGMWPDMTFWPTVCYCSSCQARCADEIGGEIPRIIDWSDPTWVRFQRKRQEWVVEYCHLITSTIKRYKPEATVAHQSWTFCGDWLFGASDALSRESDFLSCDLYADRYPLSLYSKLFQTLSEKQPFEHLNGWFYPNIHEHVVQRSADHMRAIAFSDIMNNGAAIFIDAIDPLGTINPENYVRAGRISAELEPYEPYLGGNPCQDVAVYFSFDSLFDMAENGRDVFIAFYNFDPRRTASSPTAHRNAAVSAARSLIHEHIPYGVVTRKTIEQLNRFQIVVLPNVVMLDDEEMAALRAFVENGGALYASKYTSLIRHDGQRQSSFLLADLFGVDYIGETDEVLTYVAPAVGRESLFQSFTTAHPSTLRDTQTIVKAGANTEVLATITLPFTNPGDTRYASTLADPPDRATEYPALVFHRFGKGRVIYSAGAIETWEHDAQRAIWGRLIRLLSARPFYFEAHAPKSVEIMLYDQPEHSRMILHLLNFQSGLPNIPVHDIRLKLWMDTKVVQRVVSLPKGEAVVFSAENGFVELTAPTLETYAMFAIDYSPV